MGLGLAMPEHCKQQLTCAKMTYDRMNPVVKAAEPVLVAIYEMILKR